MTDTGDEPPPSAVLSMSRFLRKGSASSGEVDDATDSYKEARSRSREAIMLHVRLADGTVVSFDYVHMGKAKFFPSGKFILRFGRDEVIAEGKNLRRLYDAITEHRVRFIHEGTDEQERLKPEDEPHIDKIEIREDIHEY